MKDVYQDLIHKLDQCKCNVTLIQRCQQCFEENRMKDCVCLLTNEKKKVSNLIEEEGKRIDCIDYMMYQVKVDMEENDECKRYK